MISFKKIAVTTVCLWLTAFTAVLADAGKNLEYSYGSGSFEISGSVVVYDGESDAEIVDAIAKDIGDLIPVKGMSETHSFEYAGTWSRDSKTQKFVPDFMATPRTFTITYNIPDDAAAEDLPSSYTYGDSVLLPEAFMDGWYFVGWMGSLALVNRIVAGEFGDKVYTVVFGKKIPVFTGVDTIEVEIWQVDDDSTICAKIDKYIEKYETEVAPVGSTKHGDSVYTVNRWVVDGNGVYTPEFKVELKTPEEVTIVASFKNSEGEDILDTLVVFSMDEDSVIDRKIEESLADKEIPLPQKADDEIYYYTLSNWERNSTTGLYEPIFMPVVKTLTVKALYGETRKEFIWVDILVTDTEEEIVEKINEAVKENFFVADKKADDLFLYDLVGWLDIGDNTYVPRFKAIAKPVSARVVYDMEKGAYVTVVIRATDTGSDIEKSIAEALGENSMPVKTSTDMYEYNFCGWNKNLEDGVFVFTPDFDSTRVVKENNESEDAVRAGGGVASVRFLLDGRFLEIAGGAGRVQVYDMRGSKVLELTNGANVRFEFPRAGSYIVKAGTEVRRFVIR